MMRIDNATPEATVRSWWRAWQHKDRAALEALAREDYLEFTGHTKEHRVGRGTLLEVAERTFQLFTISGWNLAAIQQLFPLDDAALMGYRWRLAVQRGDGVTRLYGVASDVLIREGEEEGWRYLSHHSTLLREETGRGGASGGA